MQTYKFTDNDVHRNVTHFVPLAVRYLHDYHGTFTILCALKDRLTRGEGLTVPMVRTVVNCMLVDGDVNQSELAIPTRSGDPFSQDSWYRRHILTPRTRCTTCDNTGVITCAAHIIGDGCTNGMIKCPDCDVPPHYPTRPLWATLRTTWKKTYGISVVNTARSVHRVDLSSHFRMNTSTGEVRCHLRWVCKGASMMPRTMRNVRLLTADEAGDLITENSHFDFCRTCKHITERREDQSPDKS